MSQREIEELRMGQQVLREEVRQLRTQLDLVMQLLTRRESSQPPYHQQLYLSPQMPPSWVTSPQQQRKRQQQKLPRQQRAPRNDQPRMFDPIPFPYSHMLQHLLPLKLFNLRNMPSHPEKIHADYNPNDRCDFHYGGIGLEVENFLALKHKIQYLIDNKQLTFEGGHPW